MNAEDEGFHPNLADRIDEPVLNSYGVDSVERGKGCQEQHDPVARSSARGAGRRLATLRNNAIVDGNCSPPSLVQ